MDNPRIPVLIVGATGHLGSLITKHCLTKPNLLVNVLVRNPQKNKELIQEVESHGGRVIKADVSKPETLKGVTKGMHTIISALIGDDKTVVGGQDALLNDAIETEDVKRFVPSDFSLDYRVLPEDFHPMLSQRIRFRKTLSETPIKGLFVMNGWFCETLFWMNYSGLKYWESPDIKCDVTTYEDTAKFVAAAVAKPDRIGDLKIVGNKVSFREIADIYNKVRDTNIELTKLGSLDDLKKAVENAKAKGDINQVILLGYQIPMIDGRGTINNPHNSEFPEIKVTTIEDFLIQHPNITVGTK